MSQDRFQALFLGDSIVWGQGLREEDKFSTAIVQWINEWHPQRRAYKVVKAHAGAIIGDGVSPEIDPHCHPEVPQGFPSIHQQCAAVENPEDVDLVVLNGGINDVSVRSLFNPGTTEQDLRSHMRYAFGTLFADLLATVHRKFPAKILVLGYYPILSEASSIAAVAPMASLYGVGTGGQMGWKPWKRVTRNAATFWTYSNELMEQTITALGSDRVVFVRPGFTSENAAFAPQPWVFGMKLPQLTPEDEMVEDRKRFCLMQPDATKREFCLRSSVGHPNRWGARAYFNAIYPVMQREYGF